MYSDEELLSAISAEQPRPKPTPPKPTSLAQKMDEASKSLTKAAEVAKEFGKALEKKPAPKREFVRKPHLTERPFQANEALRELQKSLAPKKKPVNKRRGQSRPNKEKN